ncbi:hypothetical protein BGZ68_007608 [Mortierella alpina]|nr:hypothetical protein BGZ68_007608 [Mortierella alpina]
MFRFYTVVTLLAITAVTVLGAPAQYNIDQGYQAPLSLHNEATIDGNLEVSGRISTDEYLLVKGIAEKDAECSSAGLIAQDGDGQILACQGGTWKPQRQTIRTAIRENKKDAFRFPAASVQCAEHERVIGGGGECSRPGMGYIFMISHKPFENGWMVGCDGGLKQEWATAHVWAICAE